MKTIALHGAEAVAESEIKLWVGITHDFLRYSIIIVSLSGLDTHATVSYALRRSSASTEIRRRRVRS
jgi:hypothetical protein